MPCRRLLIAALQLQAIVNAAQPTRRRALVSGIATAAVPSITQARVRGAAELKNLGFKKLVRRDKGVYENVTATDKESRYFDANDPSSAPHIPKEFD